MVGPRTWVFHYPYAFQQTVDGYALLWIIQLQLVCFKPAVHILLGVGYFVDSYISLCEVSDTFCLQ
jgi:hypothetical protein